MLDTYIRINGVTGGIVEDEYQPLPPLSEIPRIRWPRAPRCRMEKYFLPLALGLAANSTEIKLFSGAI